MQRSPGGFPVELPAQAIYLPGIHLTAWGDYEHTLTRTSNNTIITSFRYSINETLSEECEMSYQDVVYERHGPGAWIRLNRPKSMNTLTPDLVTEFGAALDQAQNDPEARAVVVTGTGRAFCAGADLHFLGDLAEDDRARHTAAFLEAVRVLMLRIERFPKPVICAVNGISTGGGTELLLCCDLVIAAKGARIGDGHANFGLLPGGGASVRLPRKIGVTRAKYLLFTGTLLTAEECLTYGLVNEIAPDDQLDGSVGRLVGLLASKSPLACHRTKMLVDDGLEQSSDTALRLELTVGSLHAHSYDMQEGISAFNAKRSPNFEGR
jgi:enoyl-CoA hydratase/carnithine racemase